jgi:hypothetical protein
MLAWLVLLLLAAAEAGGIIWWLRREYYPVLFNGWAALIYVGIFAADCMVAWLISALGTPGGTAGLSLLTVVALLAVVVAFLLTLFFRWVVRHDMTDIPK